MLAAPADSNESTTSWLELCKASKGGKESPAVELIIPVAGRIGSEPHT